MKTSDNPLSGELEAELTRRIIEAFRYQARHWKEMKWR